MRERGLQHRSFEWLCACLILAPCAALGQQSGAAPQAASPPADGAAQSAPPSPRSAPREPAEDIEPAVDTSAADKPSRNERTAQPDAARTRAVGNAKQGRAGRDSGGRASAGRPSGKAVDHIELGTTDITGNRELPKVMYIVPWKRSDLGDLTGKPLNSLIDQTLEPVDRNVFERSNRYFGAVTAGAPAEGGSTAGPSSAGASAGGARSAAPSQDMHRTPGGGSDPAVRDER